MGHVLQWGTWVFTPTNCTQATVIYVSVLLHRSDNICTWAYTTKRIDALLGYQPSPTSSKSSAQLTIFAPFLNEVPVFVFALAHVQMFWSYIEGMLTNFGELPLDRIHGMISLYAEDEVSESQLKNVLDVKLRQQEVLYSGGMYSLPD